MVDQSKISPYNLWGYNPTVQSLGAGYIQPYYDPFNPGLGSGQVFQGGSNTTIDDIVDSTPTCPEGYVLDDETGTCVPIEVAEEAVQTGSRSTSSFVHTTPKSSGDFNIFGYKSPTDFIDGGGAGGSGYTFGANPDSLYSKTLDNLGIRPKGYNDLVDRTTELVNTSGNTTFKPEGVAESVTETQALEHKLRAEREALQEAARKAARDRRKKRRRRGSSGGVGRAGTDTQRGTVGGGYKSEIGGASDPRAGYSNMGGLIAYRNEGGLLPGAIPTMEDQAMMEQEAMAQPPMDPTMAPGGAPMAQEVAPTAPPPPPAPLSFSDKVGEALNKIRAGRTAVPTDASLASAPGPQMMDGQGNGPVEIMPGAGSVTQGMVGPDMGPDTVDSELEEGSFVLNPEASEMHGDEVRAMMSGGMIHG